MEFYNNLEIIACFAFLYSIASGGLARTPFSDAANADLAVLRKSVRILQHLLLFGLLTMKHKDDYLAASEGAGDALSLLTWVIFGTAVVSQRLTAFSWQKSAVCPSQSDGGTNVPHFPLIEKYRVA
jgi:hypothetical protein